MDKNYNEYIQPFKTFQGTFILLLGFSAGIFAVYFLANFINVSQTKGFFVSIFLIIFGGICVFCGVSLLVGNKENTIKLNSQDFTDSIKTIYLAGNNLSGNFCGALENDKELEEYLVGSYMGARNGITVLKETTHHLMDGLLYTYCGSIKMPDARKMERVFNNPTTSSRITGKRYFVNVGRNFGDSIFSKDDLINVYKKLDELVKTALTLNVVTEQKDDYGFRIVSIYLGERPFTTTPPDVKFIMNDLEEINSHNWKDINDYNNFIGAKKTFSSVAEFEMYYNDLQGDDFGAKRLMETKKILEEKISATKNLRADARKAFGIG